MENTEKSIKKSKFYNDFIKPNLPKTKKEWYGYMMIILVVVALGLVAVNQYLSISYKAILILNPCQLCEEYQRNANAKARGGFDLGEINLNLTEGLSSGLSPSCLILVTLK